MVARLLDLVDNITSLSLSLRRAVTGCRTVLRSPNHGSAAATSTSRLTVFVPALARGLPWMLYGSATLLRSKVLRRYYVPVPLALKTVGFSVCQRRYTIWRDAPHRFARCLHTALV